MNLLYLGVTVIYAIGCCYIGLFLLSFLLKLDISETSTDWYAIIASGFLLGNATLANVWLLIGVAGIFTPGLIWATFLGAFGISAFLLRNMRLDLIHSVKASVGRIRGLAWYWQGLGVLIAVIVLNFGVMAVAYPPLGDAAAFYLVLPKIIAASHRLVPQPNYYDFSQIGLSAVMHYAALMSVASPQAAKLFSWFTVLALAGKLIAINTVVGNSSIGKIVSLALLFTSTTVTFYIYDGKVDIVGAAFGLAAYYWALRAEEVPGRSPYFLVGLFTGFAIIDKLTSIPVLVPGIVMLIIWNNFTGSVNRGERFSRAVKCLSIAGLAALCAVIPHFIKNYALFGEPFAPLLFLKSAGTLFADQAYFSYEATKQIVMTYPIALVYGMYPMQGGNLSILVLALAPLFFVFPEHNTIAARRLRQVAAVALVGIVLWVIVKPSWIMPRYILATLLLFIPLAARGVERLFSEHADHFKLLRRAAYLSVVIVVCAMIAYHGTSFRTFSRHLVSEAADYSASNPVGVAFELINRMALPGERVFFAGYYGYFLSPVVLQCMNRSDEHTDLILKRTPKAPLDWAYLYDCGFKYLFLDKSTHAHMESSMQTDAVPTWLSVTKVFDDMSATIYTINSINSEHIPSHVCRQIKPPAWDVVKISELEKPR